MKQALFDFTIKSYLIYNLMFVVTFFFLIHFIYIYVICSFLDNTSFG